MYTAEALLDIHDRAHRSLGGVMEHCQTLDAALIDRALAGFGYPTIREQLHHVLGAERYWIGVLAGRMDVDDDLEKFPTIESLLALRETVAANTTAYLQGQTTDALNLRSQFKTWGNKERTLKPAHIIVRVSCHIFDHKGQLAAMTRQLDNPIPPGLDFPFD